MIVKEFLNKCKEKLGFSSTYELAKHWGVSDQMLSNYYNEKRVPDDFACFKIAETLGLDPAYVIAQIRAENEKDEKKAEYFRVFGGVLRKQAVNIMLVVVCVASLVSVSNIGKDNFLIAIASSCATALFLRLLRFV